jgi:acyl-CoA thioester hydrolase
MRAMPSPVEITVRRRIHWFDTDTSTKEHNSAPLRWMEEAEAELLDGLGLVKELYGHLPRVHVDMDYRFPLRFWDEVKVTVRVDSVGRTSIGYAFEVRRDGAIAVEGRVTAVHIDADGKAVQLSDKHRRLLEGSEAPS